MDFKNIDGIMKYYTNSNTLSREEIFIPNDKNEQLYKLYTAFSNGKVIALIEKKIKDGKYKSPQDALNAGTITQKEFTDLEEYLAICNDAIQVDNFHLKSFIHDEN